MTKKTLYIDIDDTCAEYKEAHNANKTNDNPFPQSKLGFYLNLKIKDDCKESLLILNDYYDLYFLTAPSLKNPHSYSEKRLWVEKHFTYEWVDKLIICNHKNLLLGDYLVDDYAYGKGQDKFKGELIQFGSNKFPNWKTVTSYLVEGLTE